MADAIDVRRFADRQAAVIDARLHPADVVTHDEEDVRLLLSRSWNNCSGRQADSEDRRETDHRVSRTNRSLTHRFLPFFFEGKTCVRALNNRAMPYWRCRCEV